MTSVPIGGNGAPGPAWAAELVEQALALAEPGTELVAIADEEHRGNLRWAQNGLTTNGITRSSSLTLIAVVPGDQGGSDGERSATLTRSGVDAASLPTLVAQVSAAARSARPSTLDAGRGLSSGAVQSGFAEPSPGLAPDVFAPLVDPLASALREARSAGAVWSGYAEATLDSTWLGTSTGTRMHHHQPASRIEVTSRWRREDGQTVSSWAGTAGDTFDDVSVPALSAELDQARGWAGHDIEVEPGRRTVILTPAAVADLVIPALWAASARDAVEGRSAFGAGSAGARIGQQLMGRGVDVVSDPRDPLVPTRPFTVEHVSGPTSSVLDNGLPLERTEWIRDGVLQHLIGPASFAGTLPQTRQVIDNVVVTAPGEGSLADLVARTEDALLITCLWYIREVDQQTLLLTGLTRDGVYQVRDGKVVGAAPNFRFNVSPLDVMSSIVDASAAHRTQPREWGDYVHRAVAPAVRVEGFNLSTRSDAR